MPIPGEAGVKTAWPTVGSMVAVAGVIIAILQLSGQQSALRTASEARHEETLTRQAGIETIVGRHTAEIDQIQQTARQRQQFNDERSAKEEADIAEMQGEIKVLHDEHKALELRVDAHLEHSLPQASRPPSAKPTQWPAFLMPAILQESCPGMRCARLGG